MSHLNSNYLVPLENVKSLNERFLICYYTFSDLQNVNITLRILFRPVPDQLPKIYTILGVDYDERVLPSITTEVLKAVVVSPIKLSIIYELESIRTKT